MTVARFVRFYGGTMYRDTRYPTRDGVIPYRAFMALMAARRHVMAEERMGQTHSTGLAIARAMNGDHAAVQAADRREAREAYPGHQ